MHRLCIEIANDVPCAPALKSERRAATVDAIAIVAGNRRKAGMKLGPRFGCRKNSDSRGSQKVVEAVAQFLRADRLLDVEMRNLAQRVHTGVGASGSGDGRALA